MVDTTSTNDLTSNFKQKAAFMKTWKPANTPSNRDRLELYALHKQAVSGDAPSSFSAQSPAEKAKHSSWKNKHGLSNHEAMQQYITESDRQVRVYGMSSNSMTPTSTPSLESNNNNNNNNNSQSDHSISAQPRGLAAIPLLCAAASESRQAYLRRLAHTNINQAWWSRQEALCAAPGSVWAMPETILILVASLVERVSLQCETYLPFPSAVIQSFLWPLHNILLCLWMGLIVFCTAWTAAIELLQTLVWGSRRTGLSLPGIWKDEIHWTAQSVQILTESHQPLSARLVGLVYLPFTFLVKVTGMPPVLWASLAYSMALCLTWWYWVIILPWLSAWMVGVAVVSGNCFAIIEWAGV